MTTASQFADRLSQQLHERRKFSLIEFRYRLALMSKKKPSSSYQIPRSSLFLEQIRTSLWKWECLGCQRIFGSNRKGLLEFVARIHIKLCRSCKREAAC